MTMYFMKTSTLVAMLIGALTALGLTAASFGQSPTAQQQVVRKQVAPETGRAWKASELIGLTVRSEGDEEKGKIKDLVINPDGRVEYAAVSFGGFLGIGDKLFAVPLDAIHIEWKDNNKLNYARVNVTEQTIKQREGFDDNHWPEHADRGFVSNPTR